MEAFLVDGTFELFRSFYGAPAAKFQGKEVGAVRGLLRSLYRLTERPGPVYIACAFDHVIESFRNDLFAGYKTGDGGIVAIYSDITTLKQREEELTTKSKSLEEINKRLKSAQEQISKYLDPNVTEKIFKVGFLACSCYVSD